MLQVTQCDTTARITYDDVRARHELTMDEQGVVFMNGRLVMPPSLQRKCLKIMHAAHQGLTGMNLSRPTMFSGPGSVG